MEEFRDAVSTIHDYQIKLFADLRCLGRQTSADKKKGKYFGFKCVILLYTSSHLLEL